MHFKLQYLAIHRCMHGQSFQIRFAGLQFRARLRQLRFGLLRDEAFLLEFFDAGNAFGGEWFGECEIEFSVGELCLGNLNRRLARGQFCTDGAFINGEQWVTRLYVAADLDENLGDDSSDLRAD